MSKIIEYLAKNGITDSGEVSKLEAFFEEVEIKEQIEKIESNLYKKELAIRNDTIFWLLLIISIGIIIYLTHFDFIPSIVSIIEKYNNTNIEGNLLPILNLIDGIIKVFIILWLFSFFHKPKDISYYENENISNTILTKFRKDFFNDISFDYGDKYSFDYEDILPLFQGYEFLRETKDLSSTKINTDKNIISLNAIINSSNLIKIEDSLLFEINESGKSVTIQGFELLKRSVKKDNNGHETIDIENHCYLMRVKFKNLNINLTKNVIISSHSKYDAIFHRLILFVLFPIIFGFILNIFLWILIGPFLMFSNTLQGEQFPFYISKTLPYIIFAVFSFLIVKSKYKNNVNFENVEFEKMFKVLSEDQISSRMIITPAFMDKLIKFVKNKKNRYNFLFTSNSFYIGWNVGYGYLEIDKRKGVIKNLLDWYIEMKDIISLVKDLNLIYYSKTDPNLKQSQNNINS